MDCGEVRKNLPLYVDGALEKEMALEVESHLTYCEHCRAEMEKYIEIREAMRGFEELPLPPGYGERLKEKLDNVSRARPTFVRYVAVAAAVAVIFSGIYMMDSGNIKNEQIATESAESVADRTPAEKYPTSERPEMAKSSPQYTENKEEDGDVRAETKEETQSTFTKRKVEGNTLQDKTMADTGNGSQNTDMTATDLTGSSTNAPEQKYGIMSEKIAPPADDEALVEELIKNYDAVILQTSEEDGHLVITVKVDIDKEEQIVNELSYAAEKIEKDNDGNLKIYLRSDSGE